MTQTDPGTGFYGSAIADQYLLSNPASLPRYGSLARKALMHYAGDAYNPHIHGFMYEPVLRETIKEIIAYKVLYRAKSYDWEWIDHSLRKFIGTCMGLPLPYAQCRIDDGFMNDSKAQRLIDYSQVH